ncbi:YitT family protein [Caldicellulosiruptor changbaiensis]|uniref:YitT family protein n=1 Tax=Caldicellulosiruptor changbaiensis TaxID=1222016 RepID=A0A3T0D4A1_9FIRM|nr:YitT family protein [Caldicellulosiruptor changbaiensis]AZT89862.1 YitT family protein [Caldicellulosiruptor changbaiensis]
MLKKIFRVIYEYAAITFGSLLVALSLNLFLVPNKIAAGGFSGIATVVYYVSRFKLPVGMTMLALNIPAFIWGVKTIGVDFGVKSVYGTIALSVLTDLTAFLPCITYDKLLASVFGGALMGLGLAIVLLYEATTGGTEMLARIIHKFISFISVGQILLGLDVAVIAMASIVFKNYELGLWAVLTLFACSKVMDAILEGVNFAKALIIISDKSDIIAEKILKELDRGVTGLHGIGMWTKTEKNVLLCVVKRHEVSRVKNLVKSIDQKAFVILTDVREVLGEGFSV